jgi:hypothetical protein
VRSERTLFESSEPPPPDAPPSWLHWYLLLGTAIGGAAVVTARGVRTRSLARFGFLAVAGAWAMVAGLAGLVLAGLWGLTDHVMAYRNENLFQLNPLALVLLPGVVWAVRGSPWARAAATIAGIVAALSLLGLLLKLLPGFDQRNGPVIALALPAQLGMAAAFRHLAQVPRVRANPSRASGYSG